MRRTEEFIFWCWRQKILLLFKTQHKVLLLFKTEHKILLLIKTEHKILLLFKPEHKILLLFKTQHKILLLFKTQHKILLLFKTQHKTAPVRNSRNADVFITQNGVSISRHGWFRLPTIIPPWPSECYTYHRVQCSKTIRSAYRRRLCVSCRSWNKDSWPLRMWPIGCLETAVGNYHYSLRNSLE